MKHIISHPLSGAKILKDPLVKPDITWERYLSLLRAEAVKRKYKFELAMDQLTQWVSEDYELSATTVINEEYLEDLRAKLKAGQKLGLKGKSLSLETIHDTMTCLRILHNRVYQADQEQNILLRPFIDARLVGRFSYFNSLTEQTQKALIHFEQNGKKAPDDKQLLTGLTRTRVIGDVLTLLHLLDVKGLELITTEQIANLIKNPDANDKQYRRYARMLHTISCIYRFSMREGLLPHNPITRVDNRTFANHACRDFLPPLELERLLDIHGQKNIISIDLKNKQSVYERLVPLMYVDLGLRRNELAGLSWDNVLYNSDKDGFQIRLMPENQKMSNKITVVLPVLYPATTELIERHAALNGIKIGNANGIPLFCDKHGKQISGDTLSKIVHTVCSNLGVRTNYQSVPSCHSLRRTFATCNMKPLGLAMDIQEIAERLRTDINIIYKHYSVQNPLIQEAKAKIHRDKLKPKDTDQCIFEKIQELEHIGHNDQTIIKLLKDRVAQRIQAKTEAIVLKHTPDWISEQDGILMLQKQWNHSPTKRALRRFMQEKQALKHLGKHWTVYYDAVFIKGLVEQYEPVADHIDLQDRSLQQLLRDYQLESIGCVKLIKQTELVALLKVIRNQDQKLTDVKTCKGYLLKPAKVKLHAHVA